MTYESLSDVRNSLMGIDAKVQLSNGKYVKAINLDNAATTPAFKSVID